MFVEERLNNDLQKSLPILKERHLDLERHDLVLY